MKYFKKGLALTERSESKGFTLIELLIVIALLGALAVGMLAALDPFEQLKKGTDTGTRNTVSEIHGAVIRYFAIKNNMPWCPTGIDCPTDPTSKDLLTTPIGPADTAGSALYNIINSGELKVDFATLAANDLAKIFVTGSQLDSTVAVCYKPTAKSFKQDPNTKFNIDGTTTGVAVDCPDPAGLKACYWCVK